jgi:putative Mg2+ transporter-C (MgtC) family protein
VIGGLSSQTLAAYWSASEISANTLIFFNLVGALLLGLVVGYERTYQGRAVGMRTYGLVCMASAALTVFAGYPGLWYGGHAGVPLNPDPTRVVQGIVTGIGFLGAGVIMKDGFNIRGLTTAASVWSASVIGVLVGVGFYAAAMLLAGLSAFCMLGVHRLEKWLPSRADILVVVHFKKHLMPKQEALRDFAAQRGYEIVEDSLSIALRDGAAEWHFVASALNSHAKTSMAELAQLIGSYEGVDSFQLAHCRN